MTKKKEDKKPKVHKDLEGFDIKINEEHADLKYYDSIGSQRYTRHRL